MGEICKEAQEEEEEEVFEKAKCELQNGKEGLIEEEGREDEGDGDGEGEGK